MASNSGLTRRRGGGQPGGGGEDEETSRVSSPAPRRPDDSSRSGPETSYESGANGHKIAFDPRDISENAERSKQPKLTLMEEILLMGLKDKQVGFDRRHGCDGYAQKIWAQMLILYDVGLPLVLERQHLVRAEGMHCY